jgi:PKD repeat protein
VTSCAASGDWDNTAFVNGVVPLSGSMARAYESAGTYTYTLTCKGSTGTATQSMTANVAAMPAQAGLSFASCQQPGAPYPETGQAGISVPGGTAVQSGTPAATGCPSSTIFDGLSIVLDQEEHLPRHAVPFAASTFPSAFNQQQALPYIPNVYALLRQDSLLIFVPPVAGAADYVAYAVDAPGRTVSFAQPGATVNGVKNNSQFVQPRGAIVACAGYRNHNFEEKVSNGHHVRELSQQIELPGFVASGNYTIIVEAISTPCPFVGMQSSVDATVTAPNMANSGGLHIPALGAYVSAATQLAQYGNEIVNGQGATTSWSNRLTATTLGKPVAAGDSTFPSDPPIIAQSALSLQVPFFDEAVNAKIFDVGANALFDKFDKEIAFNPASVTKVSQSDGSLPGFSFGPPVTTTSGATAPASYQFWYINMNKADSTNALTGAATNTNASVQAFEHSGRLYDDIADGGQDVSGSLSFVPLTTGPMHLDANNVQYVHSEFRVNSESTMRRYWTWTMCGASTPSVLMDANNNPLIHPIVYASTLMTGGNNPTLINGDPNGGAPTPNAGALECLSIGPVGYPEYPRSDGIPRSSQNIMAVINPAGYQFGTINLQNSKEDSSIPAGANPGFRYVLDKNQKIIGGVVEPFDQVAPLTHYDLFIRPNRLVVFVNGRQAFCVDMSKRPLAMQYGMIVYGDLLYHSALEQANMSPQSGLANGASSSDSLEGATYNYTFEGSALYQVILNQPITSTRAWDAIGQADNIDIPPQFSTFDPAACLAPSNTDVQ